MFNQREYAARQRERYRAEGLCVYCGSRAVIHGRTYCVRCQNSHVASQRRMRDRRVAADNSKNHSHSSLQKAYFVYYTRYSAQAQEKLLFIRGKMWYNPLW